MAVYRGKCSWRKRRIKRRSGISENLYSVLTAVFILEMIVFFYQLPLKEKLKFRVVNRQQEYHVEWIIPSSSEDAVSGDIYGVRICPDTWEIQIYHSQETVHLKENGVLN